MSEQRLSVTFGAFSCDVVGYDDPFSILNRVVELFGEIARNNPAFGAGEVGMSDMERAKLAAGLTDQASRIEELADSSSPNGLRYVVSNAEADQFDAAVAPVEETSVEEAPAEDEVVIAAELDEGAVGSDLELRDTLEAINASSPVAEEETVALEVETSELLASEVAIDTPQTDLADPEPVIAATIEPVSEGESVAETAEAFDSEPVAEQALSHDAPVLETETPPEAEAVVITPALGPIDIQDSQKVGLCDS